MKECIFSKMFIRFACLILQHGKCRSVSEFEKLSRVGEGTYGIVCMYSI